MKSMGGTGRATALAVAALFGASVLAGCTIAVPAPAPTQATATTPPPTYAAPTTQAGHDAAAVAAKDMGFAAGTTLSPNVPVGFSDALGQPEASDSATPPPPEWTLRTNNVAGRMQYTNAAGCTLAYWVATNQGPLITPGDDKASTENLMKYLIPSVVPSSLTDAALPWVAEAGKKGRTIAFLGHGTKAAKGVPASIVWGRMLGTAGTGLLVTLSCPTDALLASTTPRVLAKLSVAPPSS
ncbi:MAG: hypothetical protein WBX27_01325 [Specibacter sp.]